MNTYEVETGNGLYTLKKPTGRIGMINFSLIMKAQPKSSEVDKDGNIIPSPADEDRMIETIGEWSNKVLKNIIVEDKSVFKFDDIPGEDQYVLFIAVSSDIKLLDDGLFRMHK